WRHGAVLGCLLRGGDGDASATLGYARLLPPRGGPHPSTADGGDDTAAEMPRPSVGRRPGRPPASRSADALPGHGDVARGSRRVRIAAGRGRGGVQLRGDDQGAFLDPVVEGE